MHNSFILQQYVCYTISSTCFEQHAAHPQEGKLYHHSLWYRHSSQAAVQYAGGERTAIRSPPAYCTAVYRGWRYQRLWWYKLLLMKRYNLCKVLARSTAFFQLSLPCATFFQFRTSILLISSKTSSSQRVLGLPIGLLDMGLHLILLDIIILGHAFNMA